MQLTLPLNVHHARVQNKMFVESRSTIQGNGQLYSGNSIKMVNLFQDKTQPFINERFAPQTIQQYLSNIQLNKCYAEGLNGFSGRKNAYRELGIFTIEPVGRCEKKGAYLRLSVRKYARFVLMR